MDFQHFIESSLNDLYQSTVAAFPTTVKRQFATDPLKINKLTWTPFLGVNTLMIKGLCLSESKEYNPMIVFKGVKYLPAHVDRNIIEITASDGKNYFLEQLSIEDTQALVRCNCLDFKFRFKYFDHLDHSLYGHKGKKYIANGRGKPANPLELEGVCKHILKLAKVLKESKLIK